MVKKLLLCLLLIFSLNSFSQESNFSLELNYPITVDQNFIGKGYNGLVDLGLKYRFLDFDYINLGASANGGLFKTARNGMLNQRDYTAFIIQPRVFVELDSENISKFHPGVGLGYSVVILNAHIVAGDRPGETYETTASYSKGGFNLNLGMAYDMTKRFFVQVQYDFIKLGADDRVLNIKYNTNINILKIGLGYRF